MSEQFFGGSFKSLIGRFRKDRLDENDGNITGSGQGYFYLTGLVREFISEPNAYLIKRKEEERIKVTNPDEYELMTKNSIIAYIIDRSKSIQGKPPVICYPFFPHLSLPIKPGEHVWILKEENNGRNLYYWISRKTGVKQNDDPNFTHAERFIYIDDKLRTLKEEGDLFGQKNELDERDFVSFDSLAQTNSNVNVNQISKDSIAYNEEFTYEPVPPLKRKCGDAVLQGSNNAHVHLTTEKFFASEINTKDFSGQRLLEPPGQRIPFSPAIDLCVGRKFSDLDALRNTSSDLDESGDISIIKTKRESGFEDYEAYEINKIEELFENNPISNSSAFKPGLSIDLDATNCGSRLYLSNNSAIDTTFGTNISDLTSYGGPSLATYATHNRMVADDSLRLVNRLGQSFVDMDSEGKIRLQGTTKIELAVREDNEPPSEPYVLYSELKDLLDKITGDLAFYHTLIEEILLPAIPFGIGASIKSGIDSAREALGSSDNAEITIPASINAAGDEVPESTLELPTTFLGGNVTMDKLLGEISEQINNKLPSTKIFGE